MFFTLVSRTVITKIRTPRDYLYIFLIGSVGYVALHWYLHMEKRESIVEKVREYLYYAMVLDIITAWTLMVMYPVKSDKELEEPEEVAKTNEDKPTEYTDEQKRSIMQKMQEAKRLQQQRMKDVQQPKSQPPEPEPDKVTKAVSNDTQQPEPVQNASIKENIEKQHVQSKAKIVKNEEEDCDVKRSIFSKSTEPGTDEDGSRNVSRDVSREYKEKTDTIAKMDVNVKAKQKEENNRDTEIPLYEGKKHKSNKSNK
jgi:hypothetical protein